MHRTKRAQISALIVVLSLFLAALPALAAPPCGCKYCQRHPDKACVLDGNTTTCLEFLIVALCPAQSATADVVSSEESFLAALSAPTQEPAGELNLTN
jgi:hypothetical protein